MKKIFNLLMVIAVIIAFASCNNDLNLSNPNIFTTANFWKTESDIDQGLIAVYNYFYKEGTWTRNIYTQLDGMADDGVSYAGWTELQEWTKFIFTDYNFSEVNTKIWSQHYTAIFRANQVLDNIDNVTSWSSPDAKNLVIGQAKFLRAFYYFYLEIMYENIPLVLHTSTPADLPATATPTAVWAQIESDLKDAVNYLPPQWDNADIGRPTKGAAYALLGKAYMQQHMWAQADSAFSWLVTGDGKQYYGLMSNYDDNFTDLHENNKESVFEIQFSEVYNTGYDVDNSATSNLGTQHAMNAEPQDLGWDNIEARPWLIDYYKREKTIDGKNDIRLFDNFWYYDMGKDFPDQSDTLVYGRTWASDPSWTNNRVFIKKNSSILSGLNTEFYWNDVNFRVIRYADVLLCYAEVLNELNGSPTPLAISCVDQVRERAGLPPLINSTYYNGATIESNQSLFREHLKIERALELPCEVVRWIDLKRWGLDDQTTIDSLKVRDPDFNNFIIGKSDRMPIPQSDVDNNPNLKQNPGY